MRVNEAIARSEANGKKVLKKDIAARLFEGASESAQQVNMTNLCNGTTKRIVPELSLIHISNISNISAMAVPIPAGL